LIKQILVISYHFPPIGGAGAQRPARLAGHLASHGYRSTVITGPGAAEGRWTPEDAALRHEIPDGIDLRRIPTPEPAAGTRSTERMNRWLMRPSAWSKWWIDEVERIGRAVEDVDLVYAYMSPYESAEAAARVAASLGRPWIADLGDPWALDEMMVFPSRWHRQREIARMRHWLGRADGVIMSTDEAVRRVRATFPEFERKPMAVVPNGFEPSDFAGEVEQAADRTFRIVHTGYLHTDLGRRQRRASLARRFLGGQAPGVDILTRSHIFLLEAVDRVRASSDVPVEAIFAGVLSDADREVGAGSPSARMLGYVPHDESTRLIRTADLLFLPMQNLPKNARATIVPGKTYEYLAAGRPILAAVPNGDVRDILSRAGSATICDPDDVEGMARLIRHAIDQRGRGETASADREFVAKFGYDALAERVVAFVEDVMAEHDRLNLVPATSPGGRPRRIAYLAYYFPPIGGAGAQRSLKFVRYLPEHEIQPIVVTGPGRAAGRWSPRDETLLAEVPSDVPVLKVPGPEPAPSEGWRRRAESWLRFPSIWKRWWVEGAATLAPELDVDLVYASMSPYASAEAAARIAEAIGKPWIAELRDPWALDEMVVFPTMLHRRLELSRMEAAISTAAAIVMNTPEAAARLRAACPRLSRIPVVSIANGYDGEDFSGEQTARTDHAFRIVHTGYFHTELGRHQRRMALRTRILGGSIRGVDILTRSHIFLMEAVEQLMRRDPSALIEVHLAGHLSQSDVEAAARYRFIRLHGYLSHRESVDLLRTADLLFLPMHDLPAHTRATIVPGKTYEYLAARRPILAAVPEGDARDLLASSGVAHIADPGDVDEITRAIALQLKHWRANSDVSPDDELLGRFERRHLTGVLAALIDSVLADEAPGPVRSSAGLETQRGPVTRR
jgi:glycosyltransferase involved in cell wall biosynthesis